MHRQNIRSGLEDKYFQWDNVKFFLVGNYFARTWGDVSVLFPEEITKLDKFASLPFSTLIFRYYFFFCMPTLLISGEVH